MANLKVMRLLEWRYRRKLDTKLNMNKLIEALVRPVDEDAEIIREILRLTEATPEEWAGMYNPADYEPDVGAQENALRQIRDRFKDERIKGFAHPETGVPVPPASPEDVEARWARAEPKFKASMEKFNPTAQHRLRLWKQKQPAATSGAGVCPHCGK